MAWPVFPVSELAAPGLMYEQASLQAKAKEAVRDKVCPSGHRVDRSRQHMNVGPLSIIVQRGATYLSFCFWCRQGGCGYTSEQMAVRLPA